MIESFIPGTTTGQIGTVDNRVWSETGCTCVLIASTRDQLR
jgi:hypothetical protein